MKEEVDIMTEFLRWKLMDDSIEILEEIMADRWDQVIMHYCNNKEEAHYILIDYADLGAYEIYSERGKKINKILATI